MIISIYKEIFIKNNEEFISPGIIDEKIRQFIKFYRKGNLMENNIEVSEDKKVDYSELIHKPKRYMFEDIFNLYTRNLQFSKEGRDESLDTLYFLAKCKNQKFYDSINYTKIDEKKKERINLLQMKDGNTFFEDYPPSDEEMAYCIFNGLHFINFTWDHPTIDGGFAFLKLKETHLPDRHLKQENYHKSSKTLTMEIIT